MHITPLDIGEAYKERMKKDIVLLLALQDPYYYTLAWNDSEKIDGAFHAEAYEHLGRGFRTAVKKHSIKEGLLRHGLKNGRSGLGADQMHYEI